MLMCSTHIILSLLHLHSFTGNREGPSQAFENPQRAVCQSGVRGPTVSLGNRLQNTISGSWLRRRWGGGPICIFNLHKGLTVQFQSFSILNNIFFFPWTQPGKEGSPAEPKIQSTGFWRHCRVDLLAALTVGIRMHPYVPTVRLGLLSPASPRPSSLHALASGTEPRKDCGCFFVLCFFSVALGHQESWMDSPGFLRSAQPLTSTRARGSPERSEVKVWRNKKAEDKLTGEEKGKVGRTESGKIDQVGYFVKENELYVLL